MSSEIIAIVELGSQKQRISLSQCTSYTTLSDQIYTRFGLNPKTSDYRLQKEDLNESGLFDNVDEPSFIKTMKQIASHYQENPIVRFRLIPNESNISVKRTVMTKIFLLNQTHFSTIT